MVDHLQLAPARPVDGGEVVEVVEVEPGGGAEEAARLHDAVGLHHREGVDLGLGERTHRLAQRLGEAAVELLRGHPASGPAEGALAGRRSRQRSCHFSRRTSSCSLRKPSVSASGLGGQPGM